MTNWIPDVNRFGLPQPPEWFLRLLFDQDAGLVVIPSRQARKYILARRRVFSLAVSKIAQNTLSDRLRPQSIGSDSDMLADRHAVYVDAIVARVGDVAWGSWVRSAPAILQDLRDRDMWAAGGAEKYIEKIEARERQTAEKQRKDLLDDLDHRASDAWRSYQARTGQRNQRATSGSARIVHVGTL